MLMIIKTLHNFLLRGAAVEAVGEEEVTVAEEAEARVQFIVANQEFLQTTAWKSQI